MEERKREEESAKAEDEVAKAEAKEKAASTASPTPDITATVAGAEGGNPDGFSPYTNNYIHGINGGGGDADNEKGNIYTINGGGGDDKNRKGK